MAKVLRRSLFFAVSLAFAWPAHADPLLMFLVSIAKEIAVASASQNPAPIAAVEAPTTYPGTMVEPEILRRLIDDSFLYLSPDQRAEIFEALHAQLLKPENAAMRGPIIENFAQRALQVRAAQQRLEKLTYSEKTHLAAEFQKEVKSLPEEDAAQLRQAMEKGLLPVPSDLNQLLLAAFD
jgi:hypothetical protein